MLLLISLLISSALAHSLKSGPVTDTIVHDGADAYEILGKVEKPKNIKNIKEKKYTSDIPETSYPYWSHNADSARTEDLRQENLKIHSDFGKIDATEADMYYHPVGIKQFNGNETMISNAERVKARFVVNNIYSQYHITPFYVAPGELVTIEYVSEEAKKMLSVIFNLHAVEFKDDEITHFQRIHKLRKELALSNKVNKIVWPYGGQLTFKWNGRDVYPSWNYPVEITVSGVILSSMFVYGVTDDAEFDKQLIERAGPFVSFDAGNIMGQGPHTHMKDIPNKRTSDCMHLIRTRFQISQMTAYDKSDYGNPQFGRARHPNLWYFDAYMYPGAAAYAMVGANFCGFDLGTLRSQFDYSSLLRGAWGENHEQNHHHQDDWGIGHTGEVTNNVLNLVTYALTAQSLARIDYGGGRVAHGRTSGEDHTHSYFDLWGENDDYLAFWNVLLHQFGVIQFQKFVYSDQHDLLYKKAEYGNEGAELLRAGYIFGYNMIHHWNFHQHSNDSINANAFDELKKMKLPFFHPLVNFFASGFVRNGEEFETVHPFEVPGDFKSVFEFNKYLKTREECNLAVSDPTKKGGKDLWGHFEFVRLEGRKGGWKELGKGTYEYTPPSDIFTIDKFYLVYKDTTADSEYKLVCSFKQKFGLIEVIRYDNVLDEKGNAFSDVTKAYEAAVKNEISARATSASFGTGNYDSGSSTYISIARGKFKVPTDGNYTFYLKDDDKGMLYISEEELKYDPVLDKAALQIAYNGELTSYSDSHKSENLPMTTDKEYYIAIVCYNTGGGGYASAGVKMDTEVNRIDIPSTWMANKKTMTEEDKLKSEYVPKWQEIPTINIYKGVTALHIDSSSFKVISVLEPQNIGTDPAIIFNPLTDSDHSYFVKWYLSGPGFPHIYDFSFEGEIKFHYINLVTTSQPYNMDSYIEIYLAPTADELGNETSLIFKGNYTTQNPNIIFDKEQKGNFLRITFLNNRVIWSETNGKKTGSNIAFLSFGTRLSENFTYLIPATHSKIKAPGSTFSGASIGYNGKVLVIPNKGTMEYRFPKGVHEFMVIGDKYNEMGSGNVYINGKKVGEIDRNIYLEDIQSLKYTSRSYRSCLFVSDKINGNIENTLKIEVTKGPIEIAAFVVDIDTDGMSTSSDDSSSGKKSSKTGAIVGGIIGALIACAAIAGVVVYFLKFRNPKKDSISTEGGSKSSPLSFSII